MLIGAGLIALFTILIIGGPQEELIFIDFEKEAKNVVLDESRYAEIKGINKEFTTFKKEYIKKNKSYSKEFAVLIDEQSTSLQNFTVFLDEIIKFEKASGGKYVEFRESVKGQMTEEEWGKMMDNLLKEIAKSQKETGKTLTKYNKKMSGFSESILQSLDNEDQKTALQPTLNDFSKNATRLAEEMVIYDDTELQVLSSYKSSKEDVYSVLTKYNSEMIEFYNLVFGLHQELAAKLSVKEWKKLKKDLNSI